MIEYVTISSSQAEALRGIELVCFPNTDPDDLLSLEGVRQQSKIFPEGAFVALDGEVPVGFGMGTFVDYDLSEPQHSMDDVTGHYGTDKHDPLGLWYYGTGIAVLPDYRGQGIGRALYDLRKKVVRDHNRAGIIAGAEIPGFAEVKHAMTAAEYVKSVAAGDTFDPTLSFQLRNGFEVIGVVADYMHNPKVDNWASFIVWHNPTFDMARYEEEKAAR